MTDTEAQTKYAHWHGKYLNADEIAEDMLAKIERDPEAVRRWLDPFSWKMPMMGDGRVDPKAPQSAGCLMFAGMQVRNYYGLWHPDCPYTKHDDTTMQMENGIITDPLHPDNFSGQIITKVKATLTARRKPTQF